MKNLYALAIAIVFAASAAASPGIESGMSGRLSNFHKSNVLPKKSAGGMPMMSKSDRMTKGSEALKSASKVVTAEDQAVPESYTIDGEWRFQFGDYYSSQSVGSYYTYYVATLEEDGKVHFEDPNDYELPLIADYDEMSGLLTFNKTFLFYDTYYNCYIYQCPFEYLDVDPYFDYKPIFGYFNPLAGTISFDYNNGVQWNGYSDEAGEIIDGYYFICDLEGAIKTEAIPDGPAESDWQDAGEATFMDGWVLPAFGIDQTDSQFWYKVPLQKDANNPDMYRLVNPYKYGPIASVNQSTSDGYIEFDLSDPDHVAINYNRVKAGFSYPGAGVSELYCYNQLVAFAFYYGLDPVTTAMYLGDYIPATTYKDGVVELGYIIDEEGEWYDANFGVPGALDGGLQWEDEAGNNPNMCAKIFMPQDDAVEGIISDTENAVPVYYNLNGMKVNNPENGIFIVKTGSRVEKVRIR